MPHDLCTGLAECRVRLSGLFRFNWQMGYLIVKTKPLPSFKPPSSTRSDTMRAVKSAANRTTERRLVSLLAKGGLRGWRLRPKAILGTPDFFFLEQRVAVFCDGCFWHGHPSCVRLPKANAAYWRAKIERNRKRDINISRKLRSQGYTVVRIWECHLRKRPAWCLNRIERALIQQSDGAPVGRD